VIYEVCINAVQPWWSKEQGKLRFKHVIWFGVIYENAYKWMLINDDEYELASMKIVCNMAVCDKVTYPEG
jgi:hypothetical protein